MHGFAWWAAGVGMNLLCLVAALFPPWPPPPRLVQIIRVAARNDIAAARRWLGI